MNNKIIEKSFLIHILILSLIFVCLYKFKNINILDKVDMMIDNYKTLAIEEINIVNEDAINNQELYELSDDSLNNYLIKNEEMIEQTVYLLHYYSIAIFMLLVLLLVLIENSLYRKIKFYTLVNTYDASKDTTREKLREIIRAKLNFKYRRVTLQKHIPMLYLMLYFISLFTDGNEILDRTINNLIFVLVAVITVFGFRVVIRLFKSRSEIVRILIIVLNLLIGFMIPQLYFIIGFIKSVMAIRIVIKNE
ncbi:MAG: hypothetical protein MJ245_04000 [Clostridia bacterium]|nr:hypothetical protein [Clostridia bacterium]